MTRSVSLAPVAGILVAIALAACAQIIGIEDLPELLPDARPDATPGMDGRADDGHADALWDAISGANDYKYWSPFPGHEGVVAYTGHGATHRRAFVNETAFGDLAGLPDGSILVAEDLTSADPMDLAAITVMQKQGSVWYWARFDPEGNHDVAGTTDEPGAAPCVSSGCHGDMAASKSDYVFLNNEAQDAAALYAEITMAGAEYTTWPGFGDASSPEIEPDTSGGIHGVYNRTFINDIANLDEAGLPNGSILVEEALGDADAATLLSITIMRKEAGIDAMNQDWFYAELGPDGKVQLAGTLGANNVRCSLSGCHIAGGGTGGDFVFGNN
jgi:hypothetical protein